MEVKRCYNCEKDKPLKEFSKNKSRPDGLNTQCKVCHSSYRKEKYKENIEKEKLQADKYRQENSVDTHCSFCKTPLKRYRTNVGEGKNNFCDVACTNNFHGRISEPIKNYISNTKKRAETIGLDFNLDKDYLTEIFYTQQKECCSITNIPLVLVKRGKKDTLKNAASIDRIDNSKGYIKGNVRFVCLGINYLKNRRDDSEVYDLLNDILKYYKKAE